MTLGGRTKAILVFLGLVALAGLWQGGNFWLKYGYSTGTRTGIIRKVSVKGSPVCKRLSGELTLQGGAPGQPTEVFEFSVDDKSDANPIVQSLHEAERLGTRVTLHYRQDGHFWWRCNPAEYFVTQVEK